MRLCSVWLCSKLLGGRGLIRAAFYHISTDSMLAWSLSSSWTSCLAFLRPFIEILRSLVTAWCFASILSAGCVLCFLVSSPDLDCGAEFFGDDLAFCRNSWISCGVCESPKQTLSQENSLRLALRRRCIFCQITLTYCCCLGLSTSLLLVIYVACIQIWPFYYLLSVVLKAVHLREHILDMWICKNSVECRE